MTGDFGVALASEPAAPTAKRRCRSSENGAVAPPRVPAEADDAGGNPPEDTLAPGTRGNTSRAPDAVDEGAVEANEEEEEEEDDDDDKNEDTVSAVDPAYGGDDAHMSVR